MALRCKECGAPTGSDRQEFCYKHRKQEHIRIPTISSSDETTSEYRSSGLPSAFPIAGIAMAALVGLVMLTVYGQVSTAMNTSTFSTPVVNLINLVPLVLVGAIIIGIISMAFRMTTS